MSRVPIRTHDDRRIWIITHDHRHGLSAWPVISETEPDLEDHKPDDFEEDREEFMELHGPYSINWAIEEAKKGQKNESK